MILAAVSPFPVALGAGEAGILPSLPDPLRNVAKILSLKALAAESARSKPVSLGPTETATLSVWNMNKAARHLLILRLESLKWP